MQQSILRTALDRLSNATESGEIVDLPYHWDASDDWKNSVMRPSKSPNGDNGDSTDDRIERYDTPQYQLESDVPDDDHCETCVFLTAD